MKIVFFCLTHHYCSRVPLKLSLNDIRDTIALPGKFIDLKSDINVVECDLGSLL